MNSKVKSAIRSVVSGKSSKREQNVLHSRQILIDVPVLVVVASVAREE